LLLSNALPEEGRRMTKGSGRSACFRGGVTYGYREYLRKGRVRKKLRRKFADPPRLDGLAKSLSAQSVAVERSIRFRCSTLSFARIITGKKLLRCFLRDRTSRKNRPDLQRFLAFHCRIFKKKPACTTDQKIPSRPGNDRFTAHMPAEMSYSNRLRRRFQQKNLMPIRHRVGVYGIRRRILASE